MYPLLLLTLLASTAAVAQSACPPPVVRVWVNNQPVPGSGAPLAKQMRLRVSPGPGCPTNVRYLFREAQVTPLRGPRPLTPTLVMTDSTADLTYFGKYSQPGDRINVFIPYDKLVVVSADGKQTPYPLPTGAAAKAKGIRFDWVLLKP